jgi:hypothetical protein
MLWNKHQQTADFVNKGVFSDFAFLRTCFSKFSWNCLRLATESALGWMRRDQQSRADGLAVFLMASFLF